MVNIIVKFRRNPNNPNELISFYKKKVCLILKGTKDVPKANEYWECFNWADRGTYLLVKPYRKINKDKLDEEYDRVDKFNREVKFLERFVGDDFAKLVFDDKDNTPYLLAKKPVTELAKKYTNMMIKVVGDNIWMRPNTMPAESSKEDRVEREKRAPKSGDEKPAARPRGRPKKALK